MTLIEEANEAINGALQAEKNAHDVTKEKLATSTEIIQELEYQVSHLKAKLKAVMEQEKKESSTKGLIPVRIIFIFNKQKKKKSG